MAGWTCFQLPAATLVFNTPVTADLSQPGQQASYTFNGTAGQRLFYDSLEADFDQIGVRLINPSGSIQHLNQNSDSDGGPFTLTDSGTFTLVLDGTGATTGDFKFRMVDMSGQPSLTLATPITRTLDPGYATEWYQFTAVGGERLYFDGLGANAGGSWALYGPGNEGLGSSGIGGDFEVTLPQSGVYLLGILGNSANPVPYSVQVTAAKTTISNLALDASITGTITGPGDQAIFRFNATAGQRLYYDALDGDFDGIAVRLLNPFGTVVHLNQNADSDGGPFALLDSGQYSLVIDPNGAVTGDFGFRLRNLAGVTPLTFDAPITKTLNPGFSADIYAFTGNAGDVLYFDGLGANAGGSWTLYGPSQENLGSAGIGGDFEVTLTRSGTFLVILAGNSANPVAYSVQVGQVEPTTTSLVLGTVVNGIIAAPGARDIYTLTGTAGQRWYFDALDRDFESINCRLLGPTGAAVWEVNHSSDVGPFTLAQNGTYTLVVDGNGATVGDYSFRMLNVADATAMNLTTPLTGSLSPRSRTDAYQFNGTKGQRISFDSLSATAGDATWRLVNPANQSLVSGAITTDLASVVIGESGTLLLLIEGTAENVAPLNYQVRLSDTSEAPVATMGLGTILTGTVTAATPVTNLFAASAGLTIYFDSQDRSSGGVVVDLRGPSNVLIQSLGASTDFGPLLLPFSGTYSVVTRGSGNYRFRILDLSTAPTLALGAATEATLDPGYRTDVYQFNGTVGKRLLYDALDNDFDQIAVRLLSPDGSFRINANADSDTGVVRLGTPGVYYLFLESLIATAANYNFRLLDVDAAPQMAVGTPVTGTLDPGLSAAVYRFSGTQGRLIYVDATGSNTSGQSVLYGPNNDALVAVNLAQDLEHVPLFTAEYVLVLAGNGVAAAPFTFQVYEPNAAGPEFIILSFVVSGNTATAEWTAIPGKSYVLQSKAALGNPAWTDVPGTVVASGSTATKSVTLGAGPLQFYRVRQLP